MNGKEALGILYDGFQNGMAGRSFYDIIKQDLEKLEELEKEYEKLKKRYKHRAETSNDLCKAVKQYEKAFDILQDKLDIKLEVYHNGGCTLNHKIIPNCIVSQERCLRHLEVEEYELLKEVLGNVKD